MRLYLVQHGNAVDKSVDPDRPLTSRGAHDIEKVAACLSVHRLDVTSIWHSGKTRARQTAELMAKHALPRAGTDDHPYLDPDDDPKSIAALLRKIDSNLMIVGHLPFLSRLASLLLTGDRDGDLIHFVNGGVVCLERDSTDHWRLVWAVTPDLVH